MEESELELLLADHVEAAYQAGLDAALAALPEKRNFRKSKVDFTYYDAESDGYNQALEQARENIGKLYNSSHASQAQKEEKANSKAAQKES